MMKCGRFVFLAAMLLGLLWAAAAGAEEIVIGYTGPLSGPAGEFGQDCANGVEMAVNEINATGGVNIKGKQYSFKLEKMDDQTNPQIAVNNVLQMRKEFKNNLVFTSVFNTTAALMKINMEKKNEFLIMAYTGIPQASEMGNKLMVTLGMPSTCTIKVFSDTAWDKGWRKGAMVLTTGPYGETWGKAFREEWLKKGGAITTEKTTNFFTRTDYSLAVKETLAGQPDFIAIAGPSSTAALVIEEARAKGFEGGFVLTEAARFETLRATMEKPLGLEGSIGLAMLSSVPYEATGAFLTQYKNNYKRTATWEVVINYTSMHALANAIAAAGSPTDVKAIRAAFPKVFPMLGDEYPYEFFGITPTGRLLSAPFVQTMKHGKFTKPTVYVWWAKTAKEFNAIQRSTKSSIPFIWRRMN